MDFSKSTTIHNEQGRLIGRVTPTKDAHGNSQFYATCEQRPNDEGLFWTRSAAIFWIETVAAVFFSRKMRGVA